LKKDNYIHTTFSEQAPVQDVTLTSGNEELKIANALDEGVPFFFQWIEAHLPLEQQQLLSKELKEFSQDTDFQNVKIEKLLLFPKSVVEVLYQAAKGSLLEKPQMGSIHLFYLLTHLVPQSYDVWLGLGLAYQKVANHKEAIQVFEQAKKNHPQLFNAYLSQAESYFHLSDFSLCKKLCLEALQLIPIDDDRFINFATDLLDQCEKRDGP